MIAKRYSILFILVLALTACGKRGPVRPLLQALPEAPQDLRVQQQGERFLITFGLPGKNQDDSPLTDLQGFQVYKMKYDPLRECPECRDTSVLLQSIDLDYLRDVRRVGDRLELWDSGLTPGLGYQYRVVAVNRKGGGGRPAVVKRPFFTPPAAPARLTATGHDQMVQLGWQPVTAGGKELVGYNLYRRTPAVAFSSDPINREPIPTTRFEEYGLQNGTTYDYAVRSVIKSGEWLVESPLSVAVTVTPEAGR
ncbi:hypothetical protein JCM30471_31210 [Desulfuromonas carbonis]|uniref:fibronectin type III domain-containing protein n=1 Tax=Desulfuromonas sp. DDH964 TaxID=1823759 RepID=UPI00078D5A56|nr:fibronectin type III domain-containing protein [Desulfuromonas sp. DDH964]AMV71286.1 lipoprotein [Desulfuromonas sp. DDH964]